MLHYIFYRSNVLIKTSEKFHLRMLCFQAVDMKKLQGTVLRVSTERGPLKIKAIYAEDILVASSSGPIHLGHVHGEEHVMKDVQDFYTRCMNKVFI